MGTTDSQSSKAPKIIQDFCQITYYVGPMKLYPDCVDWHELNPADPEKNEQFQGLVSKHWDESAFPAKSSATLYWASTDFITSFPGSER